MLPQTEKILTKCSRSVPYVGGASAGTFITGLIFEMFPGTREIGSIMSDYAIWPLLVVLGFIVFAASATPRPRQ